MDIQTVLTLIQAVSDSNLTGFELEEGNLRLTLKRENGTVAASSVLNSGTEKREKKNEVVKEEQPQAAPSVEQAEAPKASETVSIASDKVVVSPLVGIFYSSPSPDAPPFVKVGDTVKKGQVIGIIEAMKLMNEIESEYDGVVEAILVENEDVVEYGQPLFRIH
ncbi:MAG: acetyl-CoA carboxylase biotin carboxyl carrier protein [bacterium]|nr:acetyl-CoA carboxylase biotin carboxyl carrier protein [bacterium]